MKKVLSVLIVFSLIIGLVGCGGANKEDTSKKVGSSESKKQVEKSNEDGIQVSAAGEFPIVKEKITLTVFTDIENPANDDFMNNEFTKWLEEKTNVHLEFNVVNSKDKKQKLSVMMAGGEYPDIILNSEFTAEQQTLYGSQGLLIPLNDYIDKYGVETNKIFEKYPSVKKQFTMSDGNIYALPKLDDCFHCSVSGKMWIYKPWLEQLGMDMPRTTDDYFQLLKAIKNTDLNGNGKNDEIPLTGSSNPKAWNADPAIYIMNSFIYYNRDQKRLRVKDGHVEAVYAQPEFKEGLKFMKKLYDNGLMSSEVYTQDKQQLKALGENPDHHIVGTVAGGYQGIFMNTGKEDGRWTNFEAMPPLEGPSGEKTAYYRPLTGFAAFSITNKCKYPEVAFRIADAIYNQEVSMMSIYGLPGEGKKWEYAKGGTAVNGGDAYWTYHKSRELKNFAWSQVANAARTRDFRLSKWVANPENDQEVILYKGSLAYDKVIPKDEEVVYGLLFDKEVVSEVADLSTSLETYVDDAMVKFITGTSDIDKDWDSYLQELKNIGLDRFLQYQQDAYNQKMGL